jgi:hypothetical protein
MYRNQRATLRAELARAIERARYATHVATQPWANVPGCKDTAHSHLVRAIAVRETLRALSFKLP